MNLNTIIENANSQGGASFWYGLVLRPAGISCQPKGHSAIVTREMCETLFPAIKSDNRAIRHGAIAYPNPLTDKEIESFDLQPLCVKSGGVLSTKKQISESLAFDEVIKKLISILKIELNTESSEPVIEALNNGYPLEKAFRQFEVFKRKKEFPELFEELRELRNYISVDDLLDELT